MVKSLIKRMDEDGNLAPIMRAISDGEFFDSIRWLYEPPSKPPHCTAYGIYKEDEQGDNADLFKVVRWFSRKAYSEFTPGDGRPIIRKVGSTLRAWPPPKDTDVDYLVLTDFCDDLIRALKERRLCKVKTKAEGCRPASGRSPFKSVRSRKGNINLIITEDIEFFHKFLKAQKVAEKLVLNNKQDRITLFRAILYGEV